MKRHHRIALLAGVLALGGFADVAGAEPAGDARVQLAQYYPPGYYPPPSYYSKPPCNVGGGAFRGAARGAAGGAIFGAIGGNAGAGAAIGAGIGMIAGASRRAAARDYGYCY